MSNDMHQKELMTKRIEFHQQSSTERAILPSYISHRQILIAKKFTIFFHFIIGEVLYFDYVCKTDNCDEAQLKNPKSLLSTSRRIDFDKKKVFLTSLYLFTDKYGMRFKNPSAKYAEQLNTVLKNAIC